MDVHVLARTHNGVEYVHMSIRVLCPAMERIDFFLFFEGPFLEVARAVLFHGIAIHCHHYKDVNDPSFFLFLKFELPFSR